MAKTVEVTVDSLLTGNTSKLSSAVRSLENHLIREAEKRLAKGDGESEVRAWVSNEYARYMRSFIGRSRVTVVG